MKEHTLYVYEKHKNSPLKLDKNIEVIEQWHPEFFIQNSDKLLLKAFIKSC